MTERPHCLQPDDCPAKPGRHCIRCHAARNARRNNETRVNQTDEVKAKRVASYRQTTVGFVPPGQEQVNKDLRNLGYGKEERKRIFGEQEVVEYQRRMRARREKDLKQRY